MERYTGVVIIHGIGDEQRNDTLLQALDALTYWFNHHAGLQLQPAGQGRIWLTTALGKDADPDEPASRATMELVAPAASDPGQQTIPGTDEGAGLRLEFREVWWAESFGLPNPGTVLSWARVQWREQLTRLLLTAGVRLGPAEVARRDAARHIPQALTYRPELAVQPAATTATAPATTLGAEGAAAAAHRGTSPHAAAAQRPRRWMAAGVWCYDLVQHLWKLVQWLVSIPLIGLLLLLVGLLLVLAKIPFLQSALLTSATNTINAVALHWIGPIRVYLLQYGWSSAIRERFEREVEVFLADPQCERLVVVAHSMGTVVSYEGLTTVLARPQWQTRAAHLPMTYICLAGALRRFWLLSRTDPERLRGVLPERVRWLDFWSRYDPVAVGPLSPRAVPPLNPGASAQTRANDKALRARLADCENVDVINTDSIFSDHTTYWDNLEQVVGPIARELVAGHAALERLVEAHLATRAEVLRRHWNVGWRYLVALTGGLGLAVLLLGVDVRTNGGLGAAILSLLGQGLGSAPVQSFLQNNIPGYSAIHSYLASGNQVQSVGQVLTSNPSIVVPYVLSYYVTAQSVAVVATAVVAMGLGVWLTGALVAAPNPIAFPEATDETHAKRGIFALWVLATLPASVAALLYFGLKVSPPPGHVDPRTLPQPAFTVLMLWWLGGVLAISLWFAALFDALRSRQPVWVVALIAGGVLYFLLLSVPIGVQPNVNSVSFGYAFALPLTLLAVAVVGCLALVFPALQHRQWGLSISLLVAALLPIAYLAVLVFPAKVGFDPSGFPFGPAIIYGLSVGPYRVLHPRKVAGEGEGARVLLIAALIPFTLNYFHAGIPHWFVIPGWIVVPLAVAAVLASEVAAVRVRQWTWVVGVPLLALLTLGVQLVVLGQLAKYAGLRWTYVPALAPVSLLVASACYVLWAGPPARAVAGQPGVN
jgi:hypothetical protein